MIDQLAATRTPALFMRSPRIRKDSASRLTNETSATFPETRIMSAEAKLRDLGIVLPAAPAAVGAYVPWVRAGNLIFTSGQLPWHAGKLLCTGKLGSEVTIEQGQKAARACIINALAQIKSAIGDLEKITQVVRLDGFVHSAPGFHEHPKVLNGASEFLNEILDARGKHARTAIGINEMPLNAPVQIALIVEVAA